MNARISRIFFIIATLVTLVGATTWLSFTYYYGDDFSYRLQVPADDYDSYWYSRGEEISTWGDVWTSVCNHYSMVNGRLPNLLMLALQMLPRWVSVGLCGLFVGLLYIMIVKAVDRLNMRAVLGGVLLMWVVLPWGDGFQSLAFQLNYVPASVLYLLLYILYRRQASGWLIAFVALIAAWQHEGFYFPFMAVMLVYCIIRRTDWCWFAMLVFGATVGFVLSLVGGNEQRIAVEAVNPEHWKLTYMVSRYLSRLWPLWLALLLVGYAGLKHRREQFLCALPWLVGALVGTAQAVYLTGGGRWLWPAYLCCIIAILVVICSLVSRRKFGLHALVASGIIGSLIYALWFSGVIYWQHEVGACQKSALEDAALAAAEGRTAVYGDLPLDKIPWWTMRLVSNDQYAGAFFPRNMADHYFKNSEAFIPMLPEQLRGIPYDHWPKVPGDNDLRGIWPYYVGEAAPAVDGDSTCWQRIYLTVDSITPSFTPIDRLYLSVARATGHDKSKTWVDAEVLPIDLDGHRRGLYVVYELARTIRFRTIQKIDTLNYAD